MGSKVSYAFPAPEPIPLRGEMLLLKLIGETIELGVPPRQAAKWWLYIWHRLAETRSRVINADDDRSGNHR